MTIIDIPAPIVDSNNWAEDPEENKTKVQERKQWDNKVECILSFIGYAVGLGNFWRFPYIAYKYGGGSFLLPYIIMVFVVGFPCYFLELVLGQWSGQGPIKIYGRLAPAFKGIGYGMFSVVFFEVIYYVVVVAWALFYLINGFNSELPWSTCANGSVHCYERLINETIKGGDPYAVGPSEDYFNNALLGLDKAQHNWSNFGEMQLSLVLCLAGAWIIACTIAIKGVQSIGKAAYVTALLPYLILTSLLVYGLFFDYEGSMIGIVDFVTPEWEKLQDITVWKDAALQIVFSLGVGIGIISTWSSYNKFENNCFHDAIVVTLINCATSVFAGLVVFSFLGIMAHQQGQTNVKDVVESGRGLVFKVFPELLSKLGAWPVPQILSFLLCSMVVILGIGSICGFLDALTSGIVDYLRCSKLKGFWFTKKPTVTVTTSVICFITGLSMCTQGGLFVFDLFDRNIVGWSVLLLILLEVLMIILFYGFENFFKNIAEMGINESKIMKIYLKLTWGIITPLVLLILIISSLSNQSIQVTNMYHHPGNALWIYHLPNAENIHLKNTTLYKGAHVIATTIEGNYHVNGSVWKVEGDGKMSTVSYVWPDNIQFLGWMLSLNPVMILLITAFYQCGKRYNRNRKEWKVLEMFQPTESWKPNVTLIFDAEETLLNAR